VIELIKRTKVFGLKKEILSDRSVVYNVIIYAENGGVAWGYYGATDLRDAEKIYEQLIKIDFE